MKKILAVLQSEDECVSKIRENVYKYNGKVLLVLTEEQKETMLCQDIEGSLSSFQPSFIAEVTNLPTEVFTAIVKNLSEYDANLIIRTLMDGAGVSLQDFVDKAVEYDGAGHFLSLYDGEERVVNVHGEDFYIYRID